jgi:hypothetical protein
MPISDDMRQLIMRNGNALDIAQQARAGRRAQPAPVGPAQGQVRHDLARGNRSDHQRLKRASRSPRGLAMATRSRPRARHASRNPLHLGGRRPQQQAGARRQRAASETVVTTNLRRQGIRVTQDQAAVVPRRRRITDKDITFFTRQLATMLKAGVPLLQSFDIVARGHSNARFSRLMLDIKNKVETGSSLSQAFREHPVQFDALFCKPGRGGRILRHARRGPRPPRDVQGKILAIKGKIKSALFYPISVLVVAIIVMWVIMVFVIPSFKDVFRNFGAELPMATLIVIAISDFVVKWWWLIFLVVAGTVISVGMMYKRSDSMRYTVDRLMLKLPILGAIVEKATIARWDAHAADDVRSRRPAGRIAGRRRRRRGQHRLRAGDQAHPDRGQHRLQPHQRDGQHAPVPDDGAADDADRRGIGLARQHARQGRGLLRARGRRRGRALSSLLEPSSSCSSASSSAASSSRCTCRSSSSAP